MKKATMGSETQERIIFRIRKDTPAKVRIESDTPEHILISVGCSDTPMRCIDSIIEDYMESGMSAPEAKCFADHIIGEMRKRIVAEMLFDYTF